MNESTLVYFFVALLTMASCEIIMDFDGQKCASTYTMGYGYHHYYKVNNNSIALNGESILLKFYVQGTNDAHIMLAKDSISLGYEIVIGGGMNSISDIRKYNRDRFTSMKYMSTAKILNKDKPTGFWIQIFRNGLINVGKTGESLPFMFWIDSSPIPIRYFSFGSWESVVLQWFFNCYINKNADKIDYINEFLSPIERLRRDVLKKRNPFRNSPSLVEKVLNVNVNFDFKSIHLDVLTSTLALTGFATFEWIDKNIRWNPNAYHNISQLHLSHYELWQPELVLHNSIDPSMTIFSETKIAVNNIGNIIWRPTFDVKTKCNTDLHFWPWDIQRCSIILSTWSHKFTNVYYEVQHNTSIYHEPIHSEWKLNRILSSYIEETTPWSEIVIYIADENTSVHFNDISLKLEIEISRQPTFIEKIFYIPLICISCIWLSSFCISSNHQSKLTIVSIIVVLLVFIIAWVMSFIPVYIQNPPVLSKG
ncbi:acetylcholine receptor subunit alpha isoform X2 [Daktulosphaira vitifoliae]|uniref:acetylcholine receptor subunit alpha isoform X2 n=1 Tax=Daktulosphaira vitifoliae TaxID=58002 RepID=UPI0021AA3A8C|nr:acetylcholine receptor subunit alpha isoform X2 [Daktulosphaira vitifoliae]